VEALLSGSGCLIVKMAIDGFTLYITRVLFLSNRCSSNTSTLISSFLCKRPIVSFCADCQFNGASPPKPQRRMLDSFINSSPLIATKRIQTCFIRAMTPNTKQCQFVIFMPLKEQFPCPSYFSSTASEPHPRYLTPPPPSASSTSPS
jgi:hypothetical protein